MNLSTRCNLIDDMIRENPDATIRDYFELMGDINKIELATNINPPIIVLKENGRRPRRRKPNTISGKYLNNYRVHF